MHAPLLVPRDEVICLLHAAAEIEHSLMVQYLFAAYSLKDLPDSDPRAPQVSLLQHLLLHVAREEMAHLVTVQNLLRLLGGPLHLDREHSPFASALLPFRFKLEPVSLGSLAKYVIAESPRPLPADITPEDRAKIEGVITQRAQASNDGVCVMHVGDVFKRLIALVAMLDVEDFLGETADFQARWDEWGFHPLNRTIGGVDKSGDKSLVIDFAQSAAAERKAAAKRALERIADQGEGTDPETGDVESHFEWFYRIYTIFEQLSQQPGESVVWNIAVTPNTSVAPGTPTPHHKMIDAGIESQAERSRITEPRAQRWAQLFNLRYRILLEQLGHFLRVSERPYDAGGDRTARGYLLVGAFNEMRRLRKLARKLVQMPLRPDDDALRAGPPFELPYTTQLPDGEVARWRRHLDSSRAAVMLIEALVEDPKDAHDPFLRALKESDLADQTIYDALVGQQPIATPSQDFQKVVRILEEAVRGFSIGRHGAFWRNRTRDEFLDSSVEGAPPIHRRPDGSFDPDASRLVQRLRGPEAARMPRERPAVPAERVRYIEQWIAAGCRDNVPGGEPGLVAEPDPAPETGAPPHPPETPGFAEHIGPLFRQTDIDSMQFLFDLSVFEQVRDHADAIFAAVSTGIMPCDGAWPESQVTLFKRWIDTGKQP
jgi:hypothetical protein